MTQLQQDFKKGISLCYIGVTNQVNVITEMEEIKGGYKILTEHGLTSFAVTSSNIYYTNGL